MPKAKWLKSSQLTISNNLEIENVEYALKSADLRKPTAVFRIN